MRAGGVAPRVPRVRGGISAPTRGSRSCMRRVRGGISASTRGSRSAPRQVCTRGAAPSARTCHGGERERRAGGVGAWSPGPALGSSRHPGRGPAAPSAATRRSHPAPRQLYAGKCASSAKTCLGGERERRAGQRSVARAESRVRSVPRAESRVRSVLRSMVRSVVRCTPSSAREPGASSAPRHAARVPARNSLSHSEPCCSQEVAAGSHMSRASRQGA